MLMSVSGQKLGSLVTRKYVCEESFYIYFLDFLKIYLRSSEKERVSTSTGRGRGRGHDWSQVYICLSQFCYFLFPDIIFFIYKMKGTVLNPIKSLVWTDLCPFLQNSSSNVIIFGQRAFTEETKDI